MGNLKLLTASRFGSRLALGVLGLSMAWPLGGAAEAQVADKDLAAQVRELQSKIAKLEAALKQGHKGAPSASSDAAGMGAMPMGMMAGKKMPKGMMGMEGMDRDEMMKMMQMMQMMGAMKGGGMGMMDMDMMSGMGGSKKGMAGMGMDMDMEEMMGMMGMGSMSQSGMKGMGKMKMTSALPGFPGASHIYHIGATGFFLDHGEHIQLTTKQQSVLGGIKEKALLRKATDQRKIDEADQELWTLTASDQPDAAKIEAKVREIEKLRGDQRLAFIRAVGEAAKILTDEQRQVLLGTAKPDAHKHGAASGK